jgi:general secretion pathway protein G
MPDWTGRPMRRIEFQSVETALRDMPVTTQNDLRKTANQPRRRGFTVVELIVAMTILMILTAAAVPIVRVTIQRNKERELRHALWEMRDGVDRYKDAADRGAFQIKVDSQGYPPDLETLVKGVDSNGKKMRFLRRIPVDPMTGKTEWGLHSMQDEPDSDSWGGQNVFDVYTKSEGTALDGSKYKTW